MSATPREPSRLLTPAELAARLGLSVPWVYKNADSLPGCTRLGPRILRFEERDIEAWIAASRRLADAPKACLDQT